MLSQEDNLVIQAYYTTSLLAELVNNKFLDTPYYSEMRFGQHFIKEELKRIGIDNQGCLLMTLYAMLVIPRQITGARYRGEQERLNSFLKARVLRVITTYASDTPDVDFLRHIRNAVAHARVEFLPAQSVVFRDRGSGGETFEATLPLVHVGAFLTELQLLQRRYVEDIGARSQGSD